jgi:hypothetical protein
MAVEKAKNPGTLSRLRCNSYTPRCKPSKWSLL